MRRLEIYKQIAHLLTARDNCEKSGNTDWFDKHTDRLERIAGILPRGSGFDAGTTIDMENSRLERIVLCTSFHHMNDSGCYDGWTEHSVIITPSLAFDFHLRVTGHDRSEIKDYIAEIFEHALRELTPESVYEDSSRG